MTKNEIEIKLHHHLRLREMKRGKYGERGEKYRKESRVNTLIIKEMRKRLKKMEDLLEKLNKADRILESYTGFSVKNVGRTFKHSPYRTPKNLFYKYCLEVLSLRSIDIANFIGVNKLGPSIQRRNFIKSFRTHPENKEAWYKFTNYLHLNYEGTIFDPYRKQSDSKPTTPVVEHRQPYSTNVA